MNIVKPIYYAAFGAAFLMQAAVAEQTPRGTKYDARIQYTDYNTDNVVNIRTRVGEVSMVQLGMGETVTNEGDSGLGMGDGAAWHLNVRGRNIFFKPRAEQPDTNLIVASTKGRIYTFKLHTAKQGQPTT